MKKKNKDWLDDIINDNELDQDTTQSKKEEEDTDDIFVILERQKEEKKKAKTKSNVEESKEQALPKINENEEPIAEELKESKTETNTSQPKNKISNLRLGARIISLITAGSIVLVGGYSIYRLIIKSKAVSEQSAYYEVDNAKGTNTLEESRYTLEKVENCIKLSNTLEKLYQKYKNDFDNLNIGEVSIIDGNIAEFTESEYNELLTSIDKLEKSKDMSNNDRMQLIYKIVGSSSKLNAYLAYYAYDDIKDTILTNYHNDVTIANGDSYEMISVNYDYESNTLVISRGDNNGTEASYSIGTTGLLNNQLIEMLKTCEGNIISVNNFVNSENTTISDNTITRNSEGNLTISWNEERNKELKKFIKTTQTQLESKPLIINGALKYSIPIFFEKNNTENAQNQEQTLAYLVYARKRTM